MCSVGAPLKWKPECYDLQKFDKMRIENPVILPINSEIVQIKSEYGHVTRAVSPRVTPKSYKTSGRLKMSVWSSRHYKINKDVSHFCEISHAGKLLRVSQASGEVLLELNPVSILNWEKQDSRILGTICIFISYLVALG